MEIIFSHLRDRTVAGTRHRHELGKGARRRILAALRRAHRVLGLRRDRLGLGLASPGCGRVILLSAGLIAMAQTARADVTIGDPDGSSQYFKLEPYQCSKVNSKTPTWTCQAPTANGAWTTVTGIRENGKTGGPDIAYLKEYLAKFAGANALLLGDGDSSVQGTRAIAIGTRGVSANGDRAVAMGTSAKANGNDAIAIGTQARATKTNAIAIGEDSVAEGQDGISLGHSVGANGSGQRKIAIGTQSGLDVNGDGNIVTGTQSGNKIKGNFNIATGYNSGQGISGDGNVAIGLEAGNDVQGNYSVSIGAAAQARAEHAIALGLKSYADGTDTIAIGTGAQASSEAAVAIGRGAAARNGQAVSIGSGNIAEGYGAVSIGDPNVAIGTGAVAMGANNNATGQGAVGIGNANYAWGDGSIALGNVSRANASGSLALGNSAIADNDGDVALGSGAITKSAVGTSQMTIDNVGYSLAGAKPIATVSIGNADAERTLTNLASGRVDAGSTDAVNGSQLNAANLAIGTLGDRTRMLGYATASLLGGGAGFDESSGAINNPSYIISGTSYGDVGSALSAVDVALAGGGIRYVHVRSTGVDSDPQGYESIAIGSNARTSAVANNSIAIGHDALAGEGETVAIGVQATANGPASIALGNGAATTGAGSSAIGVGASAIGQGGTAVGAISSAQGFGSTSIGGVTSAVGDFSTAMGAGSSAIGTNATAIGGGGTYDPLTNVFTPNAATATGQRSIALGYASDAFADDTLAMGSNARASNAGDVALGSNSTTAMVIGTSSTTINGVAYGFAGGTPARTVSIGAPGAERTLTNLAAGRVSATSTDAINGSQLHATNQAVIRNASNIDTLSATIAGLDGRVTGAQGDTATNAANISALGGRVTTAEAAITSNSGAISELKQDALQWNGTASAYDAGHGGTAGKITNVAAGDVSATSSDAVNGAQLHAVSQQIATTGTAIADLQSGIANGSTGIVQQAGGPGNGAIAVGGATGGTSVSFAGTSGNRTLSDVAAGVADTDAVNLAQLKSVAASVGGTSPAAMKYDWTDSNGNGIIDTGEVDFGHATLAGTDGTVLGNVAAGDISATSTDAVNGAQLRATNQAVSQNSRDIGAVAGGQAGMFQVSASAASAPVVTGTDATAGGSGAVASAARSTAIGANASASAVNSVALGADSVATRPNSVSVGSAGAERSITNVAAGISATDAVNVGQLQNGLDSSLANAKAYTDQRLGALTFDLTDVRQDANGGVAAAMAISSVPQAFERGKGLIGMGMATWMGQQAIAIGISKADGDGRMVFKAGASYNSRGQGGASAGVGLQF